MGVTCAARYESEAVSDSLDYFPYGGIRIVRPSAGLGLRR
jgi:hypothetical protein